MASAGRSFGFFSKERKDGTIQASNYLREKSAGYQKFLDGMK
jgi:hypothetical protein